MRKTLGCLLVLAAVVLSPGAAFGASSDCGGVVRGVQSDLEALFAPVRKDPSLAQGARAAELRGKAAAIFAQARRANPDCGENIDQVANTLQSASARRQPGADAKGFLGPIGWLWNNIYYRVFQGNNVMMAVFGWELFLSPVILVFAAFAVMKGAGGALRRPVVPESVRSVNAT
jgi:hypothetical protein